MQGAPKKHYARLKIAHMFYRVKGEEGKSPVGGYVKLVIGVIKMIKT